MIGRGREITGRTVLLGFIAFFGVVFLVNGIFFWFASDSWTGLSTEDAYRKGIAFNDELARADAQRLLGWTAETGYASDMPGTGRLTFALRTEDGQPVRDRIVTATFKRPVAEGIDFSATLNSDESGRYVADITPPAPGQWDVRIEVSRPGAPSYLVETRIWSK
ncbi:MAG: FixH family protein [Rhodospirillaceae bacterium]|jgi:nitrogen fixation protein FixH|nr:FixH family protein [Rhodospirillaceae bacterium]MBT6405563.1 FixH family protein [Rhodospirillaceae bacterium]MBT6535412.1 FixH family protein [Rhodospirillaceae bacterium]MBT7362363.1 FixH family protein [Rhodospirillaceae bacterium]